MKITVEKRVGVRARKVRADRRARSHARRRIAARETSGAEGIAMTRRRHRYGSRGSVGRVAAQRIGRTMVGGSGSSGGGNRRRRRRVGTKRRYAAARRLKSWWRRIGCLHVIGRWKGRGPRGHESVVTTGFRVALGRCCRGGRRCRRCGVMMMMLVKRRIEFDEFGVHVRGSARRRRRRSTDARAARAGLFEGHPEDSFVIEARVRKCRN